MSRQSLFALALVGCWLTVPARAADESNPHDGTQTREEVFEFTQKPAVKKEGGKYIITFASKGACDATVAIVDKDGKIVRHLASGVLGPNAPEPFKKDSLAQALTWDGKDDRGKPAPAGCRVKVGLGLKAEFDRAFGSEPRLLAANGLICDAEGTLYVLKFDDEVIVTAIDRDGKYVRTVAPFPANIPVEDVPLAGRTRLDTGKVAPVTIGRECRIYPFRNPPRQTPGLTPDGKTLFLAGSGHRGPRHMLCLGTDGTGGEGSRLVLNESWQGEEQKGGVYGSGDLHMAVSRDGQWLYFGSSQKHGQHVVYRKKTADLGKGPEIRGFVACPGEVYLGEVNKPGEDNTHFNEPRGVACDREGNLYVADWGNNRIQVFDASGKYARTIAFDGAYQIHMHPESRDIYVLGWKTGGHRLAKLDSQGKLVAQMPLTPVVYYDAAHPAVFCLDWAAREPAVWVMNGLVQRNDPSRGLLQKYVERNGEFVLVLDVGKEALAAMEGWVVPTMHMHAYIAADPYREEVYLRSGGPCGGGVYTRFDGRSGKILPQLSGLRDVDEIDVGTDGLVYARVGRGGGIARFDPADGKLVPFGQLRTIDIPMRGGGRTFQDGFCVAPNGDMYAVLVEADSGFHAKLKQVGQGARLKSGQPGKDRMQGIFLQVFGPDGAVKHVSTIPGLHHSNGVRVAKNGDVYLSIAAKPAGQERPDGGGSASWGTLIRFVSAFNKFPVGQVYGSWEKPLVSGPTHIVGGMGMKLRIEPVRWQYGGVAPSMSATGGCVCGNSRFDLDGFERAFVPALQSYSVNVLDAAGNLVLRIGGYGNRDSRGKNSPVVDPKTGLLRPSRPDDPKDLRPPKELAEAIGFRMAPYVAVTDEALYVEDMGNTRVVRAALGYHAEETAAMP